MAAKDNGTHELAVDCIYTALLKLMETKEYKDINITDITKKAGVSRMAYYRNYQDKDEILTKRLDETVSDFLNKLSDDSSGADYEKENIEKFFSSFIRNPVIINIVKAGLIDHLFVAHKRMMYDIYGKILKKDLSDNHTLFQMYSNMGRMIGLILYAQDYPSLTNAEIMAAYSTGLQESL